MSDHALETMTPAPLASIYFDDAQSEQRCQPDEWDISERGLRFVSRWPFSIGTQLIVAVTHMHPRLGLCRMQLEGIVVWCEPRGQRHETTLLFLEFPDEIRPSLREFSHR